MLLSGRAERMLIADVSAKALAKARGLIHRLGLEENAVFAVADGLEAARALPPNARLDCALILGMGGDTIAGVLARGAALLGGTALILGAQTQLELTRAGVQAVGYRLTEERVVRDGFRWYTLMRAEPAAGANPPYTERELLLGPCLLARPTPEAVALWRRKAELAAAEIAAMQRSSNAKDQARLTRVQREYQHLQEALSSASNQ